MSTVTNRASRILLSSVGAITLIAGLAACAGGAESPTETAQPESTTSATTSETSSAPTTTQGEGVPAGTYSSEATPEYMVIGDVNAPIEIRVFSDYLCPHCATFTNGEEPQIIQELVESGQAKLVLSDFIVVDQTGSTALAVAARAAGEQGKYEEFHQVVMTEQDNIRSGGVIDQALMVSLAEKAGVPDTEEFLAALSSADLIAGVNASQDEGRTLNVRGTPTVLVNGVAVEMPTFAAVKDAIDAVG